MSRGPGWISAVVVLLGALFVSCAAGRAAAHGTVEGLGVTYGEDPTYRSVARILFAPPGIAAMSISSLRHPRLGRIVGLEAQLALMIPVEWMARLRTMPYAGLGLLIGDPARQAGVVGDLESRAGLATAIGGPLVAALEGRWFVLSSGRPHDLGLRTLTLLWVFP